MDLLHHPFGTPSMHLLSTVLLLWTKNAIPTAPFLADDNVLENKGEGYEFPFFECTGVLLVLPESLVVDPGGLIFPPSPLEKAGFFQETNVSNGFLPILALLIA